MSDRTDKEVFEEWMAPFINEEEQPESQPQQHNEDQLDLFVDVDKVSTTG